MKAFRFESMMLMLVILSLPSCGFIRPAGARLNRGEAKDIARQTATAEGMTLPRYKNRTLRYLPDKRTWYATFEERGYLLAIGDQFTVFIEDPHGKSRLVRGKGDGSLFTKQELDAEIRRLPAAPALH